MPAEIVSFMLNGRETVVVANPLETLKNVLRDRLGYMATKSGCSQGGCGSCTVLVEGEPMVSCLLPVKDVEGLEVTTLEGLTKTAEELHPIQKAFVENYAMQCGYCTPGMIMTAKALLDRKPLPSHEEIAEALSGNVCRCTGYQSIFAAIEEAAHQMSGHEWVAGHPVGGHTS
ncbi:MAG: (2Fe-2S)-binding protein [Candidatus Promineifilaceae bacterium]